jgi:hypothetical protein
MPHQSAKLSEETVRKLKLKDDLRERLHVVADYDLSFVTQAFNDDLIRAGRPFSCEQAYPIMVRFGKADHEIARMLEEEFKKFVVLTLLRPGIAHAPPGAVDMYWHFFILHSEQYQKFCETVWGDFQGDPKYRHHYPATDETRPGQFRAYIETRRLYLEVFGEPPVYARAGAVPVPVWNEPFAAGEGEGGQTSGDSYSGIIDPTAVRVDGALVQA